MDIYFLNLVTNFYSQTKQQSFWDTFNDLLIRSNNTYARLSISQKINLAKLTSISSINTDKNYNSFNGLARNIIMFPMDSNESFSDFEIFMLLIKRAQLIEQFASDLETTENDTNYPDPVNYNHMETGKYYAISIKKSDKKKIIAECIFRTHNRNDRLPEYLSGILCTVNNLPKTMGEEWGYRIYVDKSILKRNVKLSKKTTTNYNYNYLESFKNEDEIKKWANLFENKDEGLMFYNLLNQLNKLDYVEIYKVELNDIFLDDNGYTFGLMGTNYRFHASTDKEKDIVYMKDGDFGISEKCVENWKIFEESEKNITYYFFPWYKPPSHAITQYPFTVIAYFWGIKPKNVELHYDFDTILEYFLEYDDKTPNNFIARKPSKLLKDKGMYGSDEIILTDLIFSGFKTKDTKPYAQLYDLNSLIFFYIIYYYFMSNSKFNGEFLTILNDCFKNKLKSKIDNKLLDKTKMEKWNTSDLDKFLFGDVDDNNNYCCILPLYKNIKNHYASMIFYLAYFRSMYDMVEENDDCELNIRNAYYQKLVNYMYYYDNMLDNKLTKDIVNETIFNMVFTNQSGWSPSNENKQVVVAQNADYLFNRYYNIKIHISAFYTEEYTNLEPLWGFVADIIADCSELCKKIRPISDMYDVFYSYKKTTFIKYLWGPNTEMDKKYDQCVTNKKVTLVGGHYGVGYGVNSYGINNYDSRDPIDISNCENGQYKIVVKNIPQYYNWYKYDYKPLLDNSNQIIDTNIIKYNNNIVYVNDNNILYQINNDVINIIQQIIDANANLKNDENMKFIKIINDVTLDPKFTAITWKIFECISKDDENFIFIESGNSLCYAEYQYPQYPWDDDIDIGYITDDKYTEYFNLIKSCFERGYEVYFYTNSTKIESSSDFAKKHTVEKLINVDEIGTKFTIENVWFCKITFNLNNFKIIAKQLGLKHFYKFDNKFVSVPWIDVMPFIKKDNVYKNIYSKQLKFIETGFNVSNTKNIKILNSNIKITDDLELGLNKYKTKDKYKTETYIYNHVAGKNIGKVLIDTNDKKEFMGKYIESYNNLLAKYNEQINCKSLISDNSFKQKYLMYKMKYIKSKNHNKSH